MPGAFMRPTIGMRRGRRSRVVLTPQGWRQVSHHDVRGDGDNKARSPGRARRKPLKPSAQGRPASSGEPVVTNSCACFHRTRGCGCIGHPAFPAPSLFLRDTHDASLGQSLSRECGRAPSWLFESMNKNSTRFSHPPLEGLAGGASALRLRWKLWRDVSRPTGSSCPGLTRASTPFFRFAKTWMAGTSPAMTMRKDAAPLLA